MKKILIFLLSLGLTVSTLCACSNNPTSPSKEDIIDIVYDNEDPSFTLVRDEFSLEYLENLKPVIGSQNVLLPSTQLKFQNAIRIEPNTLIELIEVFDKDENFIFEKDSFRQDVPINVFIEEGNIVQITLEDHKQFAYKVDSSNEIIPTDEIFAIKDSKINSDATVHAISLFGTSYSLEYMEDTHSKENIKHANIIIDEGTSQCVRLIANESVSNIEVYKIDEHGERLSLLTSNIPEIESFTEINFFALYSETIPNIEISFKTEDGNTHSYIPVYNGIDNVYDFAE